MKIQLLAIALIAPFLLATAASSTRMKAIVVHAYGGPEVLKYEDAARPEPKNDQVLIKVAAAGVNPVDVAIREGRFKSDRLPFIPGLDVSGIIEKVGSNKSRFKPGDAVFAYLDFKEQGAYAEYAVAKEDEVALKPQSIDLEKAAAVPLAALTAWQALIDEAKLQPGQTVLIQGGTGGVGSFAVQIAKARGAKVIATASSANLDLLKQLGVDEAIDYTTTKFEDVVKNVDVVLNAVRGDSLARTYPVVKKGGIIVSITGDPDPAQLTKYGIRGTSMLVHPSARNLEELAGLIDEKKMTPIVSEVIPVAEAARAQKEIASTHTRGKIVLKVSDLSKPK